MATNTQRPEKQDLNPTTVDVHSMFPTIQGEGPFAGRFSIFVRLAGCNLQCPACDTIYTGDGLGRMTAEELRQRVIHLSQDTLEGTHRPNPLVVFTGGEPFRQNVVPAILSLARDRLLDVQVETNGTLFVFDEDGDEDEFDDEEDYWFDYATVVCSPKTATLDPVCVQHINYYKYIVDGNNVSPVDGLPTSALGMLQTPARPPKHFPRHRIFVQPMDSGDDEFDERSRRTAVEVCMKYGYSLSLQIHKVVELP